jgi:tripartite-type tricarboxylate transporter receptor subunit TctC
VWPCYEANNWWAIAAPAIASRSVIHKLSSEMTAYFQQPETLKRYQGQGVDVDIRTPAEVLKMIPMEIAKWKNVARVANICVEK